MYAAAVCLLPQESHNADLGAGEEVNSFAPLKTFPAKQQVESIRQEVWQQGQQH